MDLLLRISSLFVQHDEACQPRKHVCQRCPNLLLRHSHRQRGRCSYCYWGWTSDG